MAAEAEPVYLRRFSRTERLLHWVHASAFFVLLGSGLVLYVPRLSEAVGRRPAAPESPPPDPSERQEPGARVVPMPRRRTGEGRARSS